MKRKIGVDYYRILELSILLMVFGQIYSYVNAPWIISKSEWSIMIVASQTPIANVIVMLCKNVSYILIMIVIMAKCRIPKYAGIYLIIFVPICIYYAFLTVSNVGFKEALYVSNISWMYLLLLGFWLGYDIELWDRLSSFVHIPLVLYISFANLSLLSFFI